MLTRDQLHQIIDLLPDDAISRASAAIEDIVDPVTRALLMAPMDDEPYTEEERAAVAEADAELARGEYLTHDEVKQRHGLR